MKVILVAAVLAAFAVAAVESLDCRQCDSLTDSCVNTTATTCPEEAYSCTSSSTNSSHSSLGDTTLYQKMSCSSTNCTENETLVAFSVHVSDGERLDFVSQCCQDQQCEDDAYALDPPLEDQSSNTNCPACYSFNTTSCNETLQTCYQGEWCVSLFATFVNEDTTFLLKGCSNISNSTCQTLSASNKTIGNVIFISVECSEASSITTVEPTSTTQTTSTAQATSTANPNTHFRGSLTSWALASLLLGLLL